MRNISEISSIEQQGLEKYSIWNIKKNQEMDMKIKELMQHPPKAGHSGSCKALIKNWNFKFQLL